MELVIELEERLPLGSTITPDGYTKLLAELLEEQVIDCEGLLFRISGERTDLLEGLNSCIQMEANGSLAVPNHPPVRVEVLSSKNRECISKVLDKALGRATISNQSFKHILNALSGEKMDSAKIR